MNVLPGTAGDWIGLHVFPHHPPGSHFRDFLLHDMPKLLADVPLAEHECGTCVMVLRHIFSRAMRDVLSNTCHYRWIGRGGPTAWPPRLPEDGIVS
jgi:hypothetical protein